MVIAETNLKIVKITPVSIGWNASLPIYASEQFLRSVGDEYGWIGGADSQGELHCILPYTIIRKPGFRMVRFRTETVPLAGEVDLAEEKNFLEGALEYFRRSNADMVIPSGNTAIFRTYPDGAIAAPYGTFIKDLSQPEDVLLGEIRKTYRQNIRKATSAGVEIKCGMQYLDACYQLIESTLKRSGSKFRTYKDFKNRVLSLGEYVKIFVAEHKGAIQGCMIAPFSQHTAYNCYAGSSPEPVLGSMHLLHWEAIRHFRCSGVKRFDFQGVRVNPAKGSKQEGIKNYKQGFGGKLVQGYMWKYSFRPLKSIAYALGVRFLMGGDIVDQEHHALAASERNGAKASVLSRDAVDITRE
jgi:GNAT acetyltransferase-like protein